MSANSELHKLAIEIAVQTIIVLIGLSASTITFTSIFAQTTKKNKASCWEKSSWFCMIASIIFGTLALLKIIGNLDANQLEIYETFTCYFAGVQIVLFGIGLFCLIMVGIKK